MSEVDHYSENVDYIIYQQLGHMEKADWAMLAAAAIDQGNLTIEDVEAIYLEWGKKA